MSGPLHRSQCQCACHSVEGLIHCAPCCIPDPVPCCSLDDDGDGNCHIHSAPGVFRSPALHPALNRAPIKERPRKSKKEGVVTLLLLALVVVLAFAIVKAVPPAFDSPTAADWEHSGPIQANPVQADPSGWSDLTKSTVGTNCIIVTMYNDKNQADIRCKEGEFYLNHNLPKRLDFMRRRKGEDDAHASVDPRPIYTNYLGGQRMDEVPPNSMIVSCGEGAYLGDAQAFPFTYVHQITTDEAQCWPDQ